MVIAGGGVAGVAAALKAADEGHSVILVETRNYLGQEMTATYRCSTVSNQPVEMTPLARIMHMELVEKDIVTVDQFDPDALRSYLHKKISEQANIEVYFFSLASGVVCEDNQVRGVVITGQNGRQVLLGKVVV
ncbi:MAG: hypothetical protein AMS26_15520, partial [Bacteroides sp. SM23_62]